MHVVVRVPRAECPKLRAIAGDRFALAHCGVARERRRMVLENEPVGSERTQASVDRAGDPAIDRVFVDVPSMRRKALDERRRRLARAAMVSMKESERKVDRGWMLAFNHGGERI